MFFDFHVHGDIQLAKEAKRLGYNGVALIQSSKNYSNEDLSDVTEIEDDFKIFKGIEIFAKNPEDLKKKVQKFRPKVDVLIVNGGNVKINRAACENSQVDILAHPYKNRRDSGINHVLARKASENEVAIELSINSMLKTRSSVRVKTLSQFRQIINLQRKFKFPLIIGSNAHSIYGLRTPQDIITLTKCFDMDLNETIDSLSQTPINIIKKSKIRKNIIVKGVKIVG
ncbi:ribonuclease P protein component 3 [Methanobacterium oryzae]|uniref:ribonuclease P protein component 3 n=1 Tax=Methanobacterium oryzae TaxID=69540 RepID=UPI003D204D00